MRLTIQWRKWHSLLPVIYFYSCTWWILLKHRLHVIFLLKTVSGSPFPISWDISFFGWHLSPSELIKFSFAFVAQCPSTAPMYILLSVQVEWLVNPSVMDICLFKNYWSLWHLFCFREISMSESWWKAETHSPSLQSVATRMKANKPGSASQKLYSRFWVLGKSHSIRRHTQST